MPALATWHPVIEGEAFSDFDDPTAPSSFGVFPAGIYDPTVYFVGTVNWSDDRSDTIRFRLSDAPLGYSYRVADFRARYSVETPLADDQGITFTLVAIGQSAAPLFSVDLHTEIGSNGGYFNMPLDLAPGQLYGLTLNAHGNSSASLSARYLIGFTVVQEVPEPSAMLLFAMGLGALPYMARRAARTA